MRLSVKLNLDKLYNQTPSYAYFITFSNVANLTNVSFQDSETVTNIEVYGDSNYDLYIAFYTSNPVQQPEYEGEDDVAVDFSGTNTYISFTADIEDITIEDLLKLINDGFIELDQNGKTNIIAYRLNDDKNKLNKNLIPIDILEGKFTAPLGIKTLELDVVNYDIDNSYNYVYIPRLKRYYYVTNIQLTTKDHTRLLLQEDVLESHRDLIRSQNAFVTRYGGSTNSLLYDDRFPLVDSANTVYMKPSNTTGVNVVQFKYVMDEYGNPPTKYPNILCKTSSDVFTFLVKGDNISAPTGSGLPNIENGHVRGANHVYLLNFSDYGALVQACLKNDAPSTYIHNIMLLPFALSDIIPNSYLRNSHLYSGDKVLGLGTNGNEWKSSSSETDPLFPEANIDKFPYIVVADFTFNALSNITLEYNYLDYAPNTQWEIYIPFVGWVQLDPVAVINKRIMVYFTVDFDTGLSTCYIYNRTDQKVIWSGSCQLGMKLSLAVTNAEELARQKQATSLNLIMGLVSSMLSMGIGGATSNPVAMVGGIMGGANSIVNAVNSYNSMIEKAQITYGSSDNALYSPNEIIIRKTTHAKLITTTEEQNRYKELNGLPYKQYVVLSTLTSGNYIEVGEIHFNASGYNIYQTEIDEIVALLKTGVIL